MSLVGALAIGGISGCDGICNGPGCEDFYDRGRISVIGANEAATEALDVSRDVLARYDGTEIEGAAFSTAPVPGGIIVGQPAARQAVRIDRREGIGPFEPEVSWFDPARTEFGAAVVAEVSADGSGAFDLWVGAPGFDYGRGAVYLFRNAHEDTRRSIADADVVILSDTPNDRFGGRMVLCADLTGDRIPEVAVAAPFYAPPKRWDEANQFPALAGAVVMLLSEPVRDAQGTYGPDDLSRIWWGNQIGEGAGTSVVCDRDVDGDGRVDVIVGAPWANQTRGRIYALASEPLPESGPLEDAAWRVVDGFAGALDWYGTSVATVAHGGDVLLAVGGTGASNGAGRVHLYEGSELLRADEPRRLAVFEPEAARDGADHFGRWLYSGDVDGDRLGDLIIGAPDYKGEGRDAFDTGGLWVFHGARRAEWRIGTKADEADVTIAGTAAFQRIGRAVSVTDTDGDGFDELWLPTRTLPTR